MTFPYLSRLKRRIAEEAFHPSAAGVFVNPYYLARSALKGRIGAIAPRVRGDILDVGCGTKPYAKLFVNSSSYTGLEYDSARSRSQSAADVFYKGTTFPFPDDSFDVVFTSQTLEHVFHPRIFVMEISRVLKPDGLLLLAVPFSWPEHESPFDFGRYTSFGLASLLREGGMEVLAQTKTRNGTPALAQLLIALIMDLCPDSPVIRQLAAFLLAAPITAIGLLLRFSPTSKPLYLDLVVLARNGKYHQIPQ